MAEVNIKEPKDYHKYFYVSGVYQYLDCVVFV